MTPAATLGQPRRSGVARRFIATLAATATALAMLTTTAAPARADGEDVAKILAGIAALAIIAKTIDDRKDRRREAAQELEYNDDGSQYRDPQYYRPQHPRPDHARPDHNRPRHERPRHEARSPALPGNCAIEINGKRHNPMTVYSARCLDRVGFDARLPRHCAIDNRVHGRVDRVYDQNCLLDAGFRIGRQRFSD